ncbi:rhodanese-like domain-containing protein [Oceanispirochaeta sp.]|jgi:phage shock protein E|uniref:rhodanese-like domain-containing protein n=1 Tax=Oceanispirochaeta sp. TaxID=2035350 RepID=UPI00260C12CA|nr:rhodanese-like domain-containing protein [Oceanispirochaeta sp.]MDA3957342.1 rhodanese-like domain-containing protein [Oceanispirochaeta sp.]
MNLNIVFIAIGAFILYRALYPLISGQLSYKAFKELLDGDQPPLILDVRTSSEYKGGHIKGAINVSHEKLPKGLGKKILNKSNAIVVYCQSGSRSGAALRSLKGAGYSNVKNFGAISRWKESLVR